jgi:hypothetical protein
MAGAAATAMARASLARRLARYLGCRGCSLPPNPTSENNLPQQPPRTGSPQALACRKQASRDNSDRHPAPASRPAPGRPADLGSPLG